MSTTPPDLTTRTIVIKRTFDAPRDLVFKAWTDPEHLKKWWGPKDFSAPHITIDLKPGGIFHHCMRSPDGKDYWSVGYFEEVIAPEKLVYTDCFADAQGNVVSASYYGLNWPDKSLVTVLFEDIDGKTKVTVLHSNVPEGIDGDCAVGGWSESLEKLAALLV